MKKINIIYWIFTGLFAAFMILTSIEYVMSTDNIVKIISEGLGYPKYIIPFLGVAKILGGIAILLPISPRLKEWAYAGLAFDLIGATYSALSVPGPKGPVAFMLVFFFFFVMSYIYHHKRLKTRGEMIK
jgi:uncharacterized membrane protein